MTPAEMHRSIVEALRSKTGRDLEEWRQILWAEGLQTRKDRVTWLKTVHGLGHVTAGVIVDAEIGS